MSTFEFVCTVRVEASDYATACLIFDSKLDGLERNIMEVTTIEKEGV